MDLTMGQLVAGDLGRLERARQVARDTDADDRIGAAVEGGLERVDEVARGGGRGRGERGIRRGHSLPELFRGEGDTGPEALRAEAHHERDDGDPRARCDLGRQVAGGVGDDRDTGHVELLHRDPDGRRLDAGARRLTEAARADPWPGIVGTRSRPGKAVWRRASARTGYAWPMARPILAVILGTFTLRLATGITGSMLVYYFADFPAHGGEPVSPLAVGVMGALFYAAELIGSPIFGVLSDRLGHRRVMLIGPAFGGIAVIITAFTVSLPVIAFTRLLEGASTAASVPSILGFIAFATASDELLRGKAVARFEAATLAGLMFGFVTGGVLFSAFGPVAFILNALVYLVSFLIYRYGVPAHAEPEPAARAHDPEEGLRRYVRILKGSHVWLLAPTWIAINATLGLFTSQTLFQLVREPSAEFADQALMGGFEPWQMSVGLAIGGLLFFLGLFYWGGRFRDMRRTTIILYGIAGGAVMLAAALGINHFGTTAVPLLIVLVVIAAGGLFVLAGATPAAIGLLADMTESYADEGGAIMGLYSVFLCLGKITESILGCFAAQWQGLDGILYVSFVMLGIALLPLTQLRRYEHRFSDSAEVARA